MRKEIRERSVFALRSLSVFYYGGKSTVADLVWRWLGSIDVYIEPFAGTSAVLLARQTDPRHPPSRPFGVETINDAYGHIPNLYRSIKQAPDEVAKWADHIVSEADMLARQKWLVQRTYETKLFEQLETDMDFCDPKAAGIWLWGMCSTVNLANWLRHGNDRTIRLMANGHGHGIYRVGFDLIAELKLLQERLKFVRVISGDWKRAVSFMALHGDRNNPALAGVFLDPPYSLGIRDRSIYATDIADDKANRDVAAEAREWAIENGNDPDKRIALCGYEGEHTMPSDWHTVGWEAQGGFGNNHESRGKENKRIERIWFSPHCVDPDAAGAGILSMFE